MSDINSFRIIFIKINIVKADITKIYAKNIYVITEESNKIWVCKIKVSIIIKEYDFVKFFKHFTRSNQEQILMLTDKHQQLDYTFLGSYINQGNILA